MKRSCCVTDTCSCECEMNSKTKESHFDGNQPTIVAQTTQTEKQVDILHTEPSFTDNSLFVIPRKDFHKHRNKSPDIFTNLPLLV